MANPFINSSFTLRPSTNNRDKPELTLRETELTKDTSAKAGRAFKRQRLFMDRFLSNGFGLTACYDGGYGNDRYCDDQYISEDDYDEEYDTPIIKRRVSTEFPSRSTSTTINMGVNEEEYWKTRCRGMQNLLIETQNRLADSEEDQRQLRQRIRELEEQLLLQSSPSAPNENPLEQTSTKGGNEKTAVPYSNEESDQDMDQDNHKKKKGRLLSGLVVEIKENHQAVSSCFYLTDGEGLNESYDNDMEGEDVSMDVYYSEGGMLYDIDDDRNDRNDANQRRGWELEETNKKSLACPVIELE